MLVVFMHTAPGGEYQLFNSTPGGGYHSSSPLVTVLEANQGIPVSHRIFFLTLMSTGTSLLLIYTSLTA